MIKIFSPVIIFFIGYTLKRFKIFKKEDGGLFLKLAFYVGLPALYLLSFSSLHPTSDLLFLPITNILLTLCSFLLAYIIGKVMRFKKVTMGTFLVGTIMMNSQFILPFFASFYGINKLSVFALFDGTNGFMTFTFMYAIACIYGENLHGVSSVIKKVLMAPPIWAIVVGLLCNILKLHLPSLIGNTATLISNLLVPLTMLSLGIYFNFKITKLSSVLVAIGTRMLLGFVLGIIFIMLFHLTGLIRTIVLIEAMAPVGYSTITFAALEKLDEDFAASIVSLTIFIGIFTTPLLLLLMK